MLKKVFSYFVAVVIVVAILAGALLLSIGLWMSYGS